MHMINIIKINKNKKYYLLLLLCPSPEVLTTIYSVSTYIYWELVIIQVGELTRRNFDSNLFDASL